MQLSDIAPVRGKVLIRRDKQEELTGNGIIIANTDRGRRATGEVLTGEHVGKRVVFAPGITNSFDVEGGKVTLILEKDIAAFV